MSFINYESLLDFLTKHQEEYETSSGEIEEATGVVIERLEDLLNAYYQFERSTETLLKLKEMDI